MDLAEKMSIDAESWESGAVPERASTQADCDAIQAAARRDGARTSILRSDFTPPLPLQPTDDLIEVRLAEEMQYAQRLLELVGDRFISDPLILQRHETTMQSFDIIGQLLGHLAKVIGAKDKMEAIDQIGMQELRGRLKRPTASLATTGTLGALQRSCSNPFAEE